MFKPGQTVAVKPGLLEVFSINSIDGKTSSMQEGQECLIGRVEEQGGIMTLRPVATVWFFPVDAFRLVKDLPASDPKRTTVKIGGPSR